MYNKTIDDETGRMIALSSYGPIKDIERLCLDCMPNDASFNIGFGKYGVCENCHRSSMIYLFE